LDDITLILNNPTINDGFRSIPQLLTSEYWTGTGFSFGIYRPLPLISFALEKAAFGTNPWTGHLINILLFSALCCLVLAFFKRLFPGESNKGLILAATLLFITHPVHTEVVAYVKSRDELLCGLGFLGTLLFLLRFRESSRPVHLFLCGLFCAISLFSKETGLLLLILGPLVLFFSGERSRSRLAALLSPIAVPCLFYFAVRLLVLGGFSPGARDSVTFPLLLIPSSWDRLLLSLAILGKYLKLAVFPYPLVFDYSYNHLSLGPSAGIDVYLNAILTVLLLSALGIWGLREFRKREPLGLAIPLTLLPLSIAFYYSFVLGFSLAERFLFLPSLGFSLLFAALLFKLPRKAAWASLVMLAGLYAPLTFSRNRDWRDNLTLFQADVRHATNNSKISFLLGRELRRASERVSERTLRNEMLSEVVTLLERSIRIYPQYSGAHLELGAAYGMLERYNQARQELQTAIQLNPNEPDHFYILAMVDKEEGKTGDAIANLNRATALNPKDSRSWRMLAALYSQIGDRTNADRCLSMLATD
jgi:hypothetical protein